MQYLINLLQHCSSQGSPGTESKGYIQIHKREEFWRPRSPKICCPQAGQPGNLVVVIQYKSKGLKTGKPKV